MLAAYQPSTAVVIPLVRHSLHWHSRQQFGHPRPCYIGVIYSPAFVSAMPSLPRSGRHPTTARPLAPVTTTLLARRTRELERHLPLAVAGDDTGVHQARVASRRLREALPVLAAGLTRGRKAGRKIRRVTRALGIVREMDVTMAILDELTQRADVPRGALEDVRTHVLAERDRRRALMLDKLDHLNTAKLSRRLRDVAQAVAGEAEGEWRQTLATRVRVRAKRLGASIQMAGRMYSPDRLHAVRIATKKLRYALELAADAGIRAARRAVSALKRTQESLGRLNDLHVIQGHIGIVQADPPARRGPVDGGLDALRLLLEDECRHLHARYVAQLPALLELVDTCRRPLADEVAAWEGKPADDASRPKRSPASPTSRLQGAEAPAAVKARAVTSKKSPPPVGAARRRRAAVASRG